MYALEKFFVKNDINLQQARFVCMDTTNVNSGAKNGLKRHLEHKVPLLKWIGCNNYMLALTFKHLIPSFQCVAEIDIFLLNLWKYFKYRPLAMNILGNTREMYGDSPTVPICPSVTQWQAHERACERFHLHFENFLDVLSTSYAKRKEAEALGQFIQGSSCQTTATNLMLIDIFKSIKPLILFFQTSKGACSVSDANTFSELCLQRLNELKEKTNYCNSENFNCLKQTADDKTLTMSPFARVRSQEFNFEHFIDHVFTKFTDAFVKEIIDAFSQLKFWSVFDIFDPRKLPQSVTEISSYGNREIAVLIDHHGKEKATTYKSVTINQVGDIDGVAAIEEWPGFPKYMFEKRKAEE